MLKDSFSTGYTSSTNKGVLLASAIFLDLTGALGDAFDWVEDGDGEGTADVAGEDEAELNNPEFKSVDCPPE